MAGFVIVILAQIIYFSASATAWTYGEQENWPASCRGSLQSPIALSSQHARGIQYDKIKFDQSISQKKTATLTNTGRTVEVRFTNDTPPSTISGGGLQGEYVLEAFHFHWPSEHTVNGETYPLEGHFVYYSRQYGNFETALLNKNGVAVLAVFYQEIEDPGDNPGFKFVEDLPAVAHTVGQPVPLRHRLSLQNLLPLFSNVFYRYDGSLTTPNCNEVVIWTVFAVPSYISSRQWDSLDIWDEENELVETNNRKLQDINQRVVHYAKIPNP